MMGSARRLLDLVVPEWRREGNITYLEGQDELAVLSWYNWADREAAGEENFSRDRRGPQWNIPDRGALCWRLWWWHVSTGTSVVWPSHSELSWCFITPDAWHFWWGTWRNREVFSAAPVVCCWDCVPSGGWLWLEMQAQQCMTAACKMMVKSPGLPPPADQIEAQWELEGKMQFRI